MCLSIQVPAQDPSEQNPLEQLHLVWSANKAHHESFLTSWNIQAVVHLWPRPVSQVPRNRIERHLGETAAWGQITTVVRVVSFAMHEGARVESSPTWKRPIKRPTDDEASVRSSKTETRSSTVSANSIRQQESMGAYTVHVGWWLDNFDHFRYLCVYF